MLTMVIGSMFMMVIIGRTNLKHKPAGLIYLYNLRKCLQCKSMYFYPAFVLLSEIFMKHLEPRQFLQL